MKPWERYAQTEQQAQDGPWAKYAQQAQPEQAPVQPKPVQPIPVKRNWSDVPVEALVNTPASAANFASGLYQAVRHPIDTVGNMLDIAAGGLRNAMPDALVSAVNRVDPNVEAAERASRAAGAVGRFYRDRYGSMEGLKQTIATDPVGAAADLSAVLSAGAALASKAPAVSGVLRSAAQYTNPMNIAAKPVKAAGKVAANAIGAFGTHTGGMPIKTAFESGLRGGDAAKAFRENMRGAVPITDVLDAAKQNIAQMGREKAAAYRAGMAQVSGDRTILSFNGIDRAVRDAWDASTFKGQVKNAKAAEVTQKIADEINAWKQLNPTDFHTPEGLDALKQKIGGIVESIPYEEKTARMVAGGVYNAIKKEITKQAPTYAKVMKDYADATDEIREIERALSLGGKASVDTAMRKLQSLTRNNVNTNYGNRLDLARAMEQKGGVELMPALAGQALNTWVPRGIGGTVAGGVGLGGYAVGGVPGALGTLAIQSPRLVGETAFKLGQGGRIGKIPLDFMRRKGVDPATLANFMAIQGGLLSPGGMSP